MVFKKLEDLIHAYQKSKILTEPFSSSLSMKPWFFGDLTGEEAQQLLVGQPQGTFLIRLSNRPDCYAVTFVGNNSNVLKSLVTKSGQGYQVNGQGIFFNSLDEFVLHYQNQKIFTVPMQSTNVELT